MPLLLPSLSFFLLISKNTAFFTGFLSHSSTLPLWGLQMAFTFNLSSPLSFSLPLANFLFFFIWICVLVLTRVEFALNVPCHSEWLHSGDCWGLSKEIGPEWYIVGDKRSLVLSGPDHRHFVEVTWACTVADCGPSLPPACLSFSL